MSSRKIVIVGGVAAGATAAAKARRTDETAEITLIEKGPYISYANCGLPYYVGGVIKDRARLLLHTPESFGIRFNTTVLVNSEVTAIHPAEKSVTVATPDGVVTLPYDKLILAVGAETIIPPIQGLPDVPYFTMRTVSDVDAIMDDIVQNGSRSAIVVGAGYIGVETAENLRHRGLAVTMVEARDYVMPLFTPEAGLAVHEALTKKGVQVLTGTVVQSVSRTDGKITAVTAAGEQISADMLFICTGVRPNVSLAKAAGLATGETGAVQVNEQMQTSDPDIYAAGDSVEKLHRITGRKVIMPLAGPANREGRTAGENAAGGSAVFPGVIGTSVVGCFGTVAAQTGLSEEQAAAAGFDVGVSYTEDPSHAEYYPGASYVFLKVIFDKATGRVLGAAASGGDGTEKRIDVLATAILGGLTVYDLENIDLCYAPQFGSAKDPVNLNAFVAANQLRGSIKTIAPKAFLALINSDSSIQYLDVRNKIEYRVKREEGTVQIPLPELRARLNELDRSRPVYVTCAVGMRSYIATRILMQNGFDATLIMGGVEALNRFRTLAR